MLSIYNKYFFLLFVLSSCWPVSGLFAQQFATGKTGFSDETPPMYASESVLNKGNWLKLSIIESGIYKISYNDLIGFGLNPDNIDPRKIGIYFNGNGIIPEANGESRYDDLYENDIYVSGQEDGAFNTSDYILFYGLSPTKWKYNIFTARFEHTINPYTDSTFYYLCVNQQINGKRIATVASSKA